MPDAERTVIEVSLARIEQKIDHLISQGQDHEDRIRKLENRSGEKWDKVSMAVVLGIIAAVVGYAIGKIF